MNAAHVFFRAAKLYGERPFIYFQDQPLTHAQFSKLIDKATAILNARAVASGDRVAILAANKAEWLACYFAILALGAVIVPVNPALKPNEVQHIISDSSPILVFADVTLAESVGSLTQIFTLPDRMTDETDWDALPAKDFPKTQVLEVDAEHPSIIYYTSGTTGRPKGAVMPHRSTLSTMESTAEWLRIGPTDTVVVTGPFAFILHSTFAVGSNLARGSTVVVHEKFHPKDAIEAIERYRGTVVNWVPTMYLMASEYAEKEGGNLSTLRVCISGGAPLPWALVERFRAVSGRYILSGWGMSEGTPITGFDPDETPKPESIGRPLAECHVRVVGDDGRDLPDREVGELVYLSPKNMTGYLARPDATEETLRDGWIWSGDLGWRDEAGYLYIAGRKKEMIIRGGANIYPAEVEEVILQSKDVAEVAVIGLPDDRYGERTVAVLTAREGCRPDSDSLRTLCEQSLAPYKVPQDFIVVREIPRGPTGKILKRILKDNFADIVAM